MINVRRTCRYLVCRCPRCKEVVLNTCKYIIYILGEIFDKLIAVLQRLNLNENNFMIVLSALQRLKTSSVAIFISEGTPVYIPPLTYIVNKKIIKNPNEFSG